MYRNDNNVEFKVRLKRRMDELRMSPKELAGKTGLSSRIIYHYLSGKSRPLVDSLNKLVAALGVDLSYFLQEEPVELQEMQKRPESLTVGPETKLEVVPSAKVSNLLISREDIVQEITMIFEKYNLSFQEVFDVISLLKRNATRQAVNATKDMPYQGGGL